MDSKAASTEFDAIKNDVVGDGAEFREIGGGIAEGGFVVGVGAGEGVVDGVPLVVFGGPGEEGEFGDPEEIEGGVAVEEVEEFRHAEADAPEDLAGDVPGVCSEEDEVTFFDGHDFREGGLFGVGEEFDDGGFPFAVLDFDEGEAFCAELLGEVGEVVDLAGGDGGESFGVDGFDDAAVVEGGAEDFEFRRGEDGGEVADFNSETGVGFVAAVTVHRLVVGEAGKGEGDVDAVGLANDGGEHLLGHREEIFLGDEGGFDVELGEFRLAVGAEVLVAKTAGDLEVTFDTADHEELFVLLRGLGEGVEAAGGEAGGNEEVAGAFGGALREDGGFDFEEAFAVHEVADGFDNAMAEAEVVAHGSAADVEVTVFETEVFVGDAAFDGEGEDVGFAYDGQGGGDDFDLAGGEAGVFGAGEAGGDEAGDGDDVLAAEAVGLVGDLGVFIGAEDDLGDAFAVTEIDENNAAVIAAGIDPAAEGDGGVGVGGAEGGAGVGAIHEWRAGGKLKRSWWKTKQD